MEKSRYEIVKYRAVYWIVNTRYFNGRINNAPLRMAVYGTRAEAEAKIAGWLEGGVL